MLVLSEPSISQNEDLHFEQLIVEEGLSDGLIQSIYQDRNGLMWFGTGYGLNQYDGYQINVYLNNPDDSTTIDLNTITFITEDSKGRLWVGTEKSLNYFNRDLNPFLHYKHDPENPNSIANESVNSILEDDAGATFQI